MAARLKWYEPCEPPISPISFLRFLSLTSSGGSEAAASDPPWSDLGRPNGVSPRAVFFVGSKPGWTWNPTDGKWLTCGFCGGFFAIKNREINFEQIKNGFERTWMENRLQKVWSLPPMKNLGCSTFWDWWLWTCSPETAIPNRVKIDNRGAAKKSGS